MPESKKYLKLNDIDAYTIALQLSNDVWQLVLAFDRFSRDTVGKQFVRSVDSISANIAEGFGRYSKKDKIKFYRYAQGSICESLDWNEKSKDRKLISKGDYENILERLKSIQLKINSLIKFTNDKLKL